MNIGSFSKYIIALLILALSTVISGPLPASAEGGPAPPTPPAMSKPLPLLIEATSAEVHDILKNAKQPVFVYYYSETDPRAYDQELVIQQASRDWSGYILFYKVNVKKDSDPGSMVYRPPTMLLFGNDSTGEWIVLSCLSGYHDFAEVHDFIVRGLMKAPDDLMKPHSVIDAKESLNNLQLSPSSDLPVIALRYRPGSLLSEAQVEVFIKAAENWSTRIWFVLIRDTQAETAPSLHVYYAGGNHYPDHPDKSRYGFLDSLQLDQFIAEGLKPPNSIPKRMF